MPRPNHECAEDLVDRMLDRQTRAWRDGERPAAQLLVRGTSLENDTEVLLDLVYNEIVVREELGEVPLAAEYIERYPDLAEEIELHFEVHSALQEDLLEDTRRVDSADSILELELGPDAAGPQLDHYQMIAPLGEGGMGVVYKARHLLLNRLVAIKMFQPGRRPSSRELLRFNSEAQAIARLQHPNIVQIFEIGQSGGLPYLALELAEQGTLAQKLQHLTYSPRAAAELIEVLARAVAHAHQHHIIHRDLKPANVLFACDGTPKITDFGLAKVLEDTGAAHDTTRSGEPLGTPRYMAPEQASGRTDRIGPATDVYALGTLLYECVTGQVPFVASSAIETMDRIRNDEPLPPRRLQPSLPRDLETVCLHAMQKDPGQRYPSAGALADDLARFLRREPIRARPVPVWRRLCMWGRRHPARAALLLLSMVLVIGVAAALALRQQRLGKLREEVAALVKEGQVAAARQDDRTAEARFQAAWVKVRGEPALHDYELIVSGWLDDSWRRLRTQGWQQRVPPPLFDELRDEAYLRAVILDGPSIDEGREAVHAALEFTVAADPAWRLEREPLFLLDADLVLRGGDAAQALSLLDKTSTPSRLVHQRRAECLQRLGRDDEAAAERRASLRFPPRASFEFFLSGVDRFARHDTAGALRDFEQVLLLEPDHFTARCFQAASFLTLQRPGEAKVALTACIAQRPRFAWNHLLRGQACLQLADPSAAADDCQRGLDLKPRPAARLALLTAQAQALVRLGRFEEADRALDAAFALQPQSPQVRQVQAEALFRRCWPGVW